MTTTADDRVRSDACRAVSARDAADPTPRPDRVDLGTARVVHTRHWFRWTLSALIAFAVAQFAWSLVTNPNYE